MHHFINQQKARVCICSLESSLQKSLKRCQVHYWKQQKEIQHSSVQFRTFSMVPIERQNDFGQTTYHYSKKLDFRFLFMYFFLPIISYTWNNLPLEVLYFKSCTNIDNFTTVVSPIYPEENLLSTAYLKSFPLLQIYQVG